MIMYTTIRQDLHNRRLREKAGICAKIIFPKSNFQINMCYIATAGDLSLGIINN
jgi:hypothetical protein